MKKFLIAALLFAPFYSLASGTAFNFNLSSDEVDANNYSSYSTSSSSSSSIQERTYYDSRSGLGVTISGWAWKDETTTNGRIDGTVKKAMELGSYSGGLGIVNNSYDYHVADGGNGAGVDFFLLTFADSKKVTLDNVSSGYVDDHHKDERSDLILKTEAVSFDTVAGSFMSRGDVVSLAHSGDSGSTSYYSSNSSTLSNQWIVYVGASVWQGFKMNGLSGSLNNPTVDVSEPGALALFALGLAFLARRKQVS